MIVYINIMKYNPEKHHRRSIRLRDYDYSQSGAYFITICTNNRECIFGDIQDENVILNQFGQIVSNICNQIPKYFKNLQLDEYIIMPNHLHGIIITECANNHVGAIHELPSRNNDRISRRKMLIPKIIGRFKMNSSRQINILRKSLGAPVWQRNYYEHIIRNEDELNQIHKYIIDNPLNWETDDENPKNWRANPW